MRQGQNRSSLLRTRPIVCPFLNPVGHSREIIDHLAFGLGFRLTGFLSVRRFITRAPIVPETSGQVLDEWQARMTACTSLGDRSVCRQ
jgi:hypothetical protein